MALIVLATGWVIGIALGLRLGPPPVVAGIVAALGVLLALLWWSRRPARLICLALAIGGLGLLRAASGQPGLDPADVAHYAGRTVTLVGTVAEYPDRRASGTRVRLSAESIAQRGRETAVRGDVLVHGRFDAAFGDRLVVAGRLERPQDSDAIPYARYLAGRDVHVMMRNAGITSTGENVAWPPLAALYGLKADLSDTLTALLPEPEAGLARGMLLGERAAMSDDLAEAFRRTNTSHIVAISGFNVSLVAGALLALARLTRRRLTGLAIASLGVVVFLFLVGPTTASVQRAVAMGILALLAQALHREADALVGLAVAAVTMTALRPVILHDLGFQLSFLATLALVSFVPWIERGLSRLPATVRTSLAATIAAELTLLPLLASTFHQVSPVGLLANALVLPAVPLAMIAGSVTAVAGAAVPAIAAPAGWIAWLFFHWMVVAVEWCAALPFAAVAVGHVSPALVGALYLGLLGLWLGSPGSPFPSPYPRLGTVVVPIVERLPFAPTMIVLGSITTVSVMGAVAGPGGHRVTVFDLGDAALIQTAAGRNVLLASGRVTGLDEALGRTLPFWDRDVDLILVPAPSVSTPTAIDALLGRYRVRAVVVPAIPGDDDDADEARAEPTGRLARAVAELRAVADRRQVPVVTAHRDDLFDLGDEATLRALTAVEPDAAFGVELGVGAESVVFLSGPAAPAWRDLVAREPGGAGTTVVMPLAGYDDPPGRDVLAVLQPGVVIATSPIAPVRVGPSPAAPAGALLYLTRDRGSITLSFAREGTYVAFAR